LNLCIDQGNSSTKIGVFDENDLIESSAFEIDNLTEAVEIIERFNIESCIISSVTNQVSYFQSILKQRIKNYLELSHKTLVPIENRYLTPETLGKDRLAAIVGAAFLKPDTDILVIDAGTAITFDFIDSKQVYHGGNIAPGLNMRLRSLHEFTQKLPLVEPNQNSSLLGNDTNSAILSGAVYGIALEIDGYINTLKIKYPQLSTFLTGGSTFYFDTKVKNAIFAEKNLVLIGLNRILQYNVQK
jgi:type III pantothenate kinase